MDFVKRFRGKGAGRLGLGLATVVAWHRPPIGRGRHRNGLLNTIVLWTEIASGHRCAGLGAEVSPRYLSFGWARLSFIGLVPPDSFRSQCGRWYGITAKAAARNLPAHRRCRLPCFVARVQIADSACPPRLCRNNFETTGGLILDTSVAGIVHESASSPRQRRKLLSCAGFGKGGRLGMVECRRG